MRGMIIKNKNDDTQVCQITNKINDLLNFWFIYVLFRDF